MMTLLEGMKDNLDESSVDEINDFIKDLKDYLKDRKAEVEGLLAKKAKSELKEGDEVLVIYKNEETLGTVTRVGDKTFTVEIENEDGELRKVPRAYRFYLGKTEVEAVA